jgi:hypothetical protein
VTQAYTTHY